MGTMSGHSPIFNLPLGANDRSGPRDSALFVLYASGAGPPLRAVSNLNYEHAE